MPQGVQAHQLEPAILQQLYARGLLFVDIPITGHNHVSIPPLEVCWDHCTHDLSVALHLHWECWAHDDTHA